MKRDCLGIRVYNKSLRTKYIDTCSKRVSDFLNLHEPDAIKANRGYPGWEFFRRTHAVEELLNQDVNQLQGYLNRLGTKELRNALLSLESQFGRYTLEHIAFTASALNTSIRISDMIRVRNFADLIYAIPDYSQLEQDVRYHGSTTLIAARKENGYNLTAAEIESHLRTDADGKQNSNTAGVVLLNPNTMGIYYGPQELGQIIRLLDENNIFLILDETNDNVTWSSGGIKKGSSGRPQIIRQYPDNIDAECVIRLRSFSKQDLLAEYRIGYVVAAPWIIKALGDSVGANTPASAATEAVKWLSTTYGKWASGAGIQIDAFEQDFIDEVTINSNFMNALRLYVEQHVLRVEGAEVISPQNGFNLFFRIDGYSSDQLFQKLLDDCHIIVNPGPYFGLNDEEGWVRFTFANSPDKMQLAMGRLVSVFPSSGIHTPFTFRQIEQVRTWDGCTLNLKDYLPA